MSRPLRVEYEGAWYHVMNRGAGKQPIFLEKKHYKCFLDLLHEIHMRYQVEIHAYCLMGNHYHLLLHTPLPNLSRTLRHLDGVYTQRYNKFQKTDGPLFRGRFKSIVVGEKDYLLRLSRYIHLNPQAGGLVRKAEDYHWSSYPVYLNKRLAPDWLYTDKTLSFFGTNHPRYKYQAFVEEGIDKDTHHFFQQIKRIPILGTSSFIKTISEKYLKDKETCTEIPEQKEVTKTNLPTINDVIRAVANNYHVTEAELKVSKRGYENIPRNLAIYLAYQLTGNNSVQIPSALPPLSPSGILKICTKIKQQLQNDKELADAMTEITRHLLTNSGFQT